MPIKQKGIEKMISEEHLQKWERLVQEQKEDEIDFLYVFETYDIIPQLIAEVRTMKKMLRWFADHCSDLAGHNPDDWIVNAEHEVTKND